MSYTSSTSECSFCQQASWPMYTVRVIVDEYQPQRRQAPRIHTGELSELLAACPTCLYSRNDLVEWYANDPLCQQMDRLDTHN
jgi:hypothetical protein